jgi:hypothetical protein
MNGEPGIQYTIKEVNEEEDTVTLKDETGGEKKIEFGFKGIPIDEGFAVLRPRQLPLPANNGEGAEPVAEEDGDFEDINIDDVEPVEEGLVERPATQRTYPDVVQRNEMFQDLLEMLYDSAQKNPRRQRDVRQLVEQLLLLRNEVVRYGVAGDPMGSISSSFQTIAELLDQTDIPLARPVLEAKRSIYMQKSKYTDNPEELPGFDLQYMRNVIDDSKEFVNTQLGGTTGTTNWSRAGQSGPCFRTEATSRPQRR